MVSDSGTDMRGIVGFVNLCPALPCLALPCLYFTLLFHLFCQLTFLHTRTHQLICSSPNLTSPLLNQFIISLYTTSLRRLGLGRLTFTRLPTRLPAYLIHHCQYSTKHKSLSRAPWPYIPIMSSSEDDKPLVKGEFSTYSPMKSHATRSPHQE